MLKRKVPYPLDVEAGKPAWEIVDGNRPGVDPYDDAVHWIEARAGTADPVRAVAMTVMPGPQLVSAVPLARRIK